MSDSYKNGFEFVIRFNQGKQPELCRRNRRQCMCPFTSGDVCCGAWCPHFVIENCNIVDKKCQLILTCGKYTSRYLEIVE